MRQEYMTFRTVELERTSSSAAVTHGRRLLAAAPLPAWHFAAIHRQYNHSAPLRRPQLYFVHFSASFSALAFVATAKWMSDYVWGGVARVHIWFCRLTGNNSHPRQHHRSLRSLRVMTYIDTLFFFKCASLYLCVIRNSEVTGNMRNKPCAVAFEPPNYSTRTNIFIQNVRQLRTERVK